MITNITADHLGQDGLDTIEDLAHVKALVAERVRDGGTLVLNADDPWVRSLVDRPRVRADRKRIVWFGLDPRQPVIVEHLAKGATAYLLEDGWLVQATGARRTPLRAAGRAARLRTAGPRRTPPRTPWPRSPPPGRWAPGRRRWPRRLADFDPAVANPGRGTLLRLGDVSLFVDYAHNPAALAATLRTLHRLWGPDRCVAAVTLPGDRRDDLLAASAQVVADGVTRAVLYDDEDPRGRAPGEVSALVEREMRARRPKLRAVRADGYREAVLAGLELAAPGDVLLVLYEKLEPVLALLDRAGRGAGAALTVPALPRRRRPAWSPAPVRDLVKGAARR